ncbi:MAG: hypothetical protein ACTHZX_02320 [Microbacterium sp.]
MNATNRAVNRIVLLIVGLVLFVAGAAGVTAAVWPLAGELWTRGLTIATDGMVELDAATRVSEATTASWFVVAVLAVLLLIVVFAFVVCSRLGGGRSGIVVREESADGAQGPVTIRNGFASDALTHSLAARADTLSARVSARRVRGSDVLHVRVTPRQNTSPADVADAVTRLVDNLAHLTGRETPTYVSIHSGVRSRLSADQSRVS